MVKKDKSKKYTSIKELELMLNISKGLIQELKKKYPKLGKPYKGKFSQHILEYANTFIYEDTKLDDLSKSMKTDLWAEVAYIESFCKWLEYEKRIVPISGVKQRVIKHKWEKMNKTLNDIYGNSLPKKTDIEGYKLIGRLEGLAWAINELEKEK